MPTTLYKEIIRRNNYKNSNINRYSNGNSNSNNDKNRVI